jgi:Tol biopolymer transport system component
VNSTAELVHRSRVDDAVRLTLVATHEFSLEIWREELYELGNRVEGKATKPASLVDNVCGHAHPEDNAGRCPLGGGGDVAGGARTALIVASYEYEDPGLRRLRAPARDAEALAEVLSDPAIGGFDVRTVLNEPAHSITLAVEEFFADRQADDLLLLHFSCHGVKDEDGDLYFAAANTRLGLLDATAVAADVVNRRMNRTRSRRVVLLLDCCYAGAFERGMTTRGGTSLDLEERLGGRGRAVITASTAMEYAFEGQQLAQAPEGRPSVFTSALVEGLRSGEADEDLDGLIGLDELYEYIYDKVRAETPHQTPSKWAFGFQGELYIARRSTPVTTATPLPDELREAIDSSFAGVRESVIRELERLLLGRHVGLALAARQALEHLTVDDSRKVAAAAADVLARAPRPQAPPLWGLDDSPTTPAKPVEPEPTRSEPTRSEPTLQPKPDPSLAARHEPERSTDPGRTVVEKPKTSGGQEPPTSGPRTEGGGRAGSVVSPLSRLPRPALVAVAALLVAVVAVTFFLLNRSGGGTAAVQDHGGLVIPDNNVVVNERTSDGGSRIVSIDVDTGEQQQLTGAAADLAPTISPDRRMIMFLSTPIGPPYKPPYEPWVMNANGTEAHALFDASSPCTYSTRPAWNPRGDQLAVVCVDAHDVTTGLFIVDLDGQKIQEITSLPDAAVGAPTWRDDRTIYVAAEPGPGPGENSTLWKIDTVDRSSTQITNGDSGSDSHPDWSDNGGLLFLRSSAPDALGVIWTVDPKDGSRSAWPLDALVDSPTWSPNGDRIAYLAPDAANNRRLWVTLTRGPHGSALVPNTATAIGPPAWGSR